MLITLSSVLLVHLMVRVVKKKTKMTTVQLVLIMYHGSRVQFTNLRQNVWPYQNSADVLWWRN